MNHPPRNRESEYAVLGSILRNPECRHKVREVLPEPECFYHDACQKTYAVLQEGLVVNLVTAAGRLYRRGQIADTGYRWLTDLWDAGYAPEIVLYHARQVRECWLRRRMLHAAQEMMNNARAPYAPAEDMVADAARRLAG